MSLFRCNYTPRHISFGHLFFYVVRTPAPEYTLRSPISLSRIPLKAPTQHECEAAETLLSLFSPGLESLLLPNESYSMDVEVQAPTPNDLGISATPLSPLPLSQDIPFNSSGCDDYSQNEQDIEMGSMSRVFGRSAPRKSTRCWWHWKTFVKHAFPSWISSLPFSAEIPLNSTLIGSLSYVTVNEYDLEESQRLPNLRCLLKSNCESSEASRRASAHIQSPESDQRSP